MISSDKQAARVQRVRSKAKVDGTRAVLVLNLNHIRYLVGFSGSDGALIISDRDIFLLVDPRYTTQAQYEASAETIEYRDQIEGIAKTVLRTGANELGFDAAAISFDRYHTLKAKLGGIELVPVTGELESIRCIKDEDEIDLIRKAAAIASSAYVSMLSFVHRGIEERDLALELEYKMRAAGAEAIAFDTIFASGPNAALPHARPGRRKLAPGDFVVVDYGATFMGYHSDETCTFALGAIDPTQRLVYDVVKQAHDLGISMIRPGIACREVDEAVRRHIEANGFGDYFGHGTGHGVGLEVHEPPRLARNSDAVLEPGMVVTVEPGIYIPGKGGVRIEDLVLVRQHDCEILSQVPKDLRVLTEG